MANYFVIVNPIAGRGAGRRDIAQIEQAMQALGLAYQLFQTTGPGHAIELARQAASDSADVVVAVGGDGTVNEVLNGLMQAKKDSPREVALGVLAIGRGNDFAFGMGVPLGVIEGCRTLAENFRRHIDVGRAVGGKFPGGRYFGNGVGIGFDTVVGFEAAKLPLTGLPAYAVAALKTIFLYDHAAILEVQFDVEGNGGPKTLTQPFLMVSIMNGRRMGGGFMMAPQGITDDGLLDMCLAGQLNRRGILALIPRFLQGTQSSHPAIQTGRARTVRIRAIQGSIPAHADGETLCEAGQELSLELLPKQVELVCKA